MDSSDSGSDFDGFGPGDLVERDDGSDISVNEASSGESESETDEEVEEQVPVRWTENLIPRPKHAFTGSEPGATVGLHAHRKEIDFFRLFFPDILIQLIVQQTNLCGATTKNSAT
jgi:hypothetical protein